MYDIRPRAGLLDRLCREHDISRDELARRLGVVSTTAWRVDTGRVRPSTTFIAAVLSLTGQPFEECFEVKTT